MTSWWLTLAQAAEPVPAGLVEGFRVDLNAIVHALIFVAIGVTIFGLSFVVMEKVTPFSIRKEIEEDQNDALGIIIGSVIIGLAIIIGAAIHGG